MIHVQSLIQLLVFFHSENRFQVIAIISNEFVEISKDHFISFVALVHQASNPTITIRNSIVIGDTTQDCTDVPDNSTLSEKYGVKVIPRVYAASSDDAPAGRAGISFPYFSGDNMLPQHPWSGIGTYPASKFLVFFLSIETNSDWFCLSLRS